MMEEIEHHEHADVMSENTSDPKLVDKLAEAAADNLNISIESQAHPLTPSSQQATLLPTLQPPSQLPDFSAPLGGGNLLTSSPGPAPSGLGSVPLVASQLPAATPSIVGATPPTGHYLTTVGGVQDHQPPAHPISQDTYTAPVRLETPHEASDSIPVDISQSEEQLSPSVKQTSGGLFGWFSGSQIMSKVMEKTKSSVETVITTLDPGMKEIIYAGGDIDVVVTSDKEVKVGAVRDAFLKVFGKATVKGQGSQANIAPQPVGYTAGLKGAEERMENLWRDGFVDKNQTILSVENFIVEQFPDRWFDIGCVVLTDPSHKIELQVFTQAVPIPSEYVGQALDQTPDDYSLRWSGLPVTVGEIIHRNLPHVDPSDWHMVFAGVSRRDMISMAAKSIAHMYKQRLAQVST